MVPIGGVEDVSKRNINVMNNIGSVASLAEDN